MQTSKIRNTMDWKKLLSSATAFGIAVAPLASSLDAQAKPKGNAYGYSKDKKDKKDKNGRSREERQENRDDRDGYDDYGSNNVTVSGVVTRDLVGDRFEVRGDDGRVFVVDTGGRESERITVGDRVRLNGAFENQIFIAQNVRLTRNTGDGDNNGNTNGRLNISGTVTRDLVGDRFQIRADDGVVYSVDTNNRESRRITVGDRVQVSGTLNGRIISADSVRILLNTRPGSGYGATVLRGVVTRDLYGREFQIRAENGRTYTVRADDAEPLRLSRGDRVEVRGTLNSTLFFAQSVRIVTNDDRGLVDFPGTVTSVSSSTRFVVRADNGRSYNVDARTGVSNLSSGDRVRIGGYVEDGIVFADRVQITRNDDIGAGQNQTVNFPGVVTGRDNFGLLKVRGDNGRSYLVRYTGTSFRTGDRVQVSGTFLRGVVLANSVTRR